MRHPHGSGAVALGRGAERFCVLIAFHLGAAHVQRESLFDGEEPAADEDGVRIMRGHGLFGRQQVNFYEDAILCGTDLSMRESALAVSRLRDLLDAPHVRRLFRVRELRRHAVARALSEVMES